MLLSFANVAQHYRDECKQLVDGVKSSCPCRSDVLDSALDLAVLQPGVRSNLDDESRLVLPFLHSEQTIVRLHDISHNSAGNFP